MKQYLKISIILLLSWSIELFASKSPHTTSIESPDGSLQKIQSPYSICSLTEEERKKTVFLPESCYAIIKKESAVKAAVVGPLYPCFFIAVYDPVDEESIVFHMHEANRNADVIELIHKHLNRKNREEFIFHMFSKEIDCLSFEKQKSKTAILQRKNFEETFKALCAAFKPSKDRFKALFCKIKTSLDVPDEYFGLERWVYFSHNTSYSYPPFKEKLFRTKYDSQNRIDKILLSKSNYIKVLLEYRPDHRFVLEKDKKLEFTDVSSKVGLEFLYKITNS